MLLVIKEIYKMYSVVEKIDNLLNENNKKILRDLLNNPQTVNDIDNAISNMDKESKKKVLDIIRDVSKGESKYTLYHGTTNKIADDIIERGFRVTTGKRSGFMGSEREVQNLGIFLSDSEQLAHAYGANRDKYDGKDTTVLTVYPQISNMLDMRTWNSKIPLDIRKTSLEALSREEGKEIKKPTKEDMYWLMDQPEIVNLIKQNGYDSVVFSESPQTKRELGVSSSIKANTYLVFEPSKLKVKRKLKTKEELLKFLR